MCSPISCRSRGRAWDRESSPVKDRRATTVLRRTRLQKSRQLWPQRLREVRVSLIWVDGSRPVVIVSLFWNSAVWLLNCDRHEDLRQAAWILTIPLLKFARCCFKPRPHQQHCRSNIVECYKSRTLLRHCCWCGRGFRASWSTVFVVYQGAGGRAKTLTWRKLVQ